MSRADIAHRSVVVLHQVFGDVDAERVQFRAQGFAAGRDDVPPSGVADQRSGIRRSGTVAPPRPCGHSPQQGASWTAASAEIVSGLVPEPQRLVAYTTTQDDPVISSRPLGSGLRGRFHRQSLFHPNKSP
jgi:hypothetical protein